jgi:BirA family biotin operon repressor/biotin-[acetyl-CoA-carboxylase] ligase
LYLSLAVQLSAPLHTLSALSLVAGLAAATAIEASCQAPIQLKWPNDLLLNEQKCGGCLVEVISDPQRSTALHWVIVGVGINLRFATDPDHDPGIDQRWTDLHQAGHAVDINRLAAALIDQLLVHIASFAEAGFAAMRSRWQARDAFDGQAVVVHQGDDQVLHGQAAGVTDAGELLLIRAEGQQRISSGEVSLRRASD